MWIPSRAETQYTSEYVTRLKQLNNNFKPNEGQKRLLVPFVHYDEAHQKKRIFARAGRKGGKSFAACYAAARIAAYPNSIAYIIGPTIKQTKEIYWDSRKLRAVIPPEWNAQFKETELRVKLPWNSFIKIDGSEEYSSYEGTEYDIMILDEFKDQDPRFYQYCYPNLLARDGILVIIGTPPREDDEDHHYLTLLAEAEADQDWACVHWTSLDNEFLPNGAKWLEAERIKYYARGEGPQFEREYNAKIVPGGSDTVFSMFSEKNLRKQRWMMARLAKDWKNIEFVRFTDPGTTSVHATIFMAINHYTSEIFCIAEIYETDPFETSTRRIYPRIELVGKAIGRGKEWLEGYDEAEAWYANEVADSFPDSSLIPSDKGMRDINDDISIIKDAMLEEKFYVARDGCPNLVKEIRKLRKDKKGKLVGNDHALDCVRYGIRATGYTISPKARGPRPKDPILATLVKEIPDYEESESFEDYVAEPDIIIEEDEWEI